MGIYRGAGGSGDAINDASSEASAAVNAAAAAEVSRVAAQAARVGAELAETTAQVYSDNANIYKTAAQTAAIASASSASAASTSASTATTKASEASTSATNSASSATASASSATAASTSATNAANSATAAASSATSSSTSASNASSSATAAASSASSASTSATTATTQATNASTSATAAASSATSASGSATTATTQAGVATTQASNSASSASAASTSATNSANSATLAGTYASNASTSATNASNSATNAATSATAAATSETNAANSATSSASSFYNFENRYLGSKASAPTVDNHGNTLLVGALYFNSSSSSMKVWNGTSWLDAYASLSGALIANNNLSDLNNTTTARTNLGLGNVTNESKATMFTNPTFTGNTVITGNLTVQGTITTVNTQTISVQDNLIYLNSGSVNANPDLGIAGNYNDGTYRHTGVFRDATDGIWKFFKGYTPEPDAATEIDTTHASFALADLQVNRLYGAVTGNLTGNADTVTNGLYSSGSYANPSWLTSLAETKVLPSQIGYSGKILRTNGTATYWGSLTTDEVTEGTTNQYFTTTRARNSISAPAGSGLTYNASTGQMYCNISQYTDALARSAISANGSLSYNPTTGVMSFNDAVTSVFGRTGSVVMSSSDVTTALGFTPYNATNPNGYITSSGSITGNAATATTAASCSGNSATATTANSISNAGGWSVTPSGTKLYFAYNGVNKGSLDSSGNFIVIGNVSAYGTP